MKTDSLSTERLTRKIRDIVQPVKAAIKIETGENYDERVIEDSIKVGLANMLDRIEEDMLRMFVSPERREFQELVVRLERNSAAVVEAQSEVTEAAAEGVFAGNRPFSKEKLSAMIAYLTAKGHNVYKTSLNKLLFYSDLSYFYLRNQGISGAVYYNRQFGPVAEQAGPTLDDLTERGIVKVVPRTQTLESADPVSLSATLTNDEKKVLDWVAETYGPMTASAISDLSHDEKAYKFTRPNEPIAYAYSKFLKKLPPRDLLDNQAA